MPKSAGVPSRTPVLIGIMKVVEPIEIKSETNNYSSLPQKKLSIRILFATLFFILTIPIFFLTFEIYIQTSDYSGTKEVEITQGMGLRDIAFLLEQKEVINSRWLFLGYTFLKGDSSRIQVGIYTFPSSSLVHVEQKLVSGGETKTIVIPEGWTLHDIKSLLAKESITSPEKFSLAANVPETQAFKEQFTFLRSLPPSAGLEGFLFPDTYKVVNNITAKDLITLMLENFASKFSPELHTETARQEKTIYKIVTMASLIEKEVISDNDRALVAGILWKRISLGIPLQVDATLNYIKKERGISSPNGKISILDTRIESPYNTYKYAGLPKGPIDNPGLSAIKAALYPKESPYLYYLSTPAGKTIFSKTLEEHTAAKAKYLK